jgi:hypothetical protein
VLRRAADAAGDVEVGGDLGARLPDLVGVRPPAGARDGARAADHAAEQARQLLEHAEALRGADAAAARDDDRRLCKRQATRRGVDALRDLHDEILGAQFRPERLDRGLACRRRLHRERVGGDGEQLQRAVQTRLLEQAAAPAHTRHLGGVPRCGGDAIGRERRAGHDRGVREDLVAAIAAGGDDRGRPDPPGQLRDRARPSLGRVAAVELGDMDRRDAVLAECGRGLRGSRTGHHGLDGLAVREATCQR